MVMSGFWCCVGEVCLRFCGPRRDACPGETTFAVPPVVLVGVVMVFLRAEGSEDAEADELHDDSREESEQEKPEDPVPPVDDALLIDLDEVPDREGQVSEDDGAKPGIVEGPQSAIRDDAVGDELRGKTHQYGRKP